MESFNLHKIAFLGQVALLGLALSNQVMSGRPNGKKIGRVCPWDPSEHVDMSVSPAIQTTWNPMNQRTRCAKEDIGFHRSILRFHGKIVGKTKGPGTIRSPPTHWKRCKRSVVPLPTPGPTPVSVDDHWLIVFFGAVGFLPLEVLAPERAEESSKCIGQMCGNNPWGMTVRLVAARRRASPWMRSSRPKKPSSLARRRRLEPQVRSPEM